MADEYPSVCCDFNEKHLEFITPVNNQVKTWNALNGKINNIYMDMVTPGSEITAFCMDENKKRFVIGDSKGRLNVYNAVNGTMMKELKSHQDGEIISINFTRTTETRLIITAGADKKIFIHEDSNLYESSLRREI